MKKHDYLREVNDNIDQPMQVKYIRQQQIMQKADNSVAIGDTSLPKREAKQNINQVTTIISILYINNAFFGFIKEKTILNALSLLCMLLWIIVAMGKEGFFQDCFTTCSSLMIYTGFLFFAFFFTGANMNSIFWQNLRNAFFSLICSFLCLYILPQEDKIKRKVFICLLINILLGCVYSLYRIQGNPLIPRIIAMGYKGIEDYLGKNVSIAGIITYGGIYGMALIFPSLLYWISQKQGAEKIVPITIAIFLTVVIYKAQFAIAVFSVITGVILYMILYNGKSELRYFTSGLFIIIALIIMINWDSILSVIHDANVLPVELQQKVHELLLYSEGKKLTGTNLNSRSTYYIKTFEAIVKNNFVGRVFSNNAKGYGHSEWEDMAANYGILAPILICVFFHKFTKRISVYLKGKTIILYRIQLLIFLIIGFVDPIFHSRTMSYLLFLSPLMLSLYGTGKEIPASCLNSQDREQFENRCRYIRYADK